MANIDSYDLIVVGAGLAGATLACALAGSPGAESLRIAVLESGVEPVQFTGAEFDPRVVSLTLASQRLLDDIGVWKRISAQRVSRYFDMRVWDGEGTAAIHFSSAEAQVSHLGHIVENSVAVRALRQQLLSLPQVNLIQSARVVALEPPTSVQKLVTITLANAQVLQAPLVIAADGARSSVCELAGFETREWDYGQQAIVTTVRTENSHEYTAWQRFMSTGPLAFLPLNRVADEHYCSIVWSADTELAQTLMQLNDANFCTRLGAAFEHRLGAIEGVAERFCIPLRQRHAREYIQPGIVLVGDAAHNIHPLAGQGINLGLADVSVLVAELARALRRDLPLNDLSILRRYQRQRKTENLTMMGAMEGFKRLFASRSLAVISARNLGIQTLDSLPLLKRYIVQQIIS